MSLRDILLRLLEKKKDEEQEEKPQEEPEVAKNRRVFWAVTIALVALVGTSLYSSLLMPPNERRAVAHAEKYGSAGSQEFKVQPEVQSAPQSQPRVQRDNRPPTQEKERRSQTREKREKKETEEQRLAREARNGSHYARPLTIVQNGEVLSSSHRNGNPREDRGHSKQTLEIPPAQRQLASNNEEQIANGDVWKRDFFERNKDQTGVLQPPESPYMVMRGTVIPVELLTNIDTQTPGQVSARVTQDIKDTATGQHVMIPQDAVIVGRYETELGYQRKLPTAWDQMNFPNGETMALSAFPGADHTGAAGMEIDVNRHLLRRAGYIAMVTLTGAAARAGSYAGGGSRNFDDALQQQATREVYRESRQSYSRGGYSGATGTAEAGYQFLLQVTESLRFPGDYYEREDMYALSE